MSDDTRTGGAAGSESTLDTPSAGLPTSSTSAPPENGTRGEMADLRADALADAGSYVPGSDGVTESGTIVIEDGVIPKRLRRPLDLARFALALLLAAAAVALGWFATGTTSGLEDDLVEGARLLPDPVVLIINIIGGIGTLALPIAGAIALIVRRRVRQLFDALVALLIAVVALSGLSILVSEIADPRLLVALTGSNDPSNAATSPILGGLLAFITASRLISRRPWNVLTLVVMGSLVIVAILSASIAVAGLAASLMLGWAIGLAVRYILGIQTTRPSGAEVADALDRGGLPITMLRAQESTSRGRRYLATGRSGQSLNVTVLDRDLEGAGLLRAIWTSLRLREEPRNSSFNMRRSLEHAALVSYAGESAGVPEPRLLLASEVGPDSCVLAYEHIDGTPFAQSSDLTDDDLRGAWRAVKTMHQHQITHRSLNDDQLVRSPDGTVRVIGQDSGSVASSDVAMRIDVAELLCTLAMLTDVDRAVNTGVEILGVDGIGRALPALQPVA